MRPVWPYRLAAIGLAGFAAAVLIVRALGMARVRDAPPGTAAPAHRAGSLTVDVLVLNVDPLIAARGNRPLHEALAWQDPRALADVYVADVAKATAGAVRFRVVEWRDVRAFHRKVDGFVYTADEYLNNLRVGSGWHEPDTADYRGTLAEQGVPAMVDAGRIDEVWFFGGPHFGYGEAAMAGPRAFDVNGPVIDGVPVDRPFAIMGFNYERGVAEMLEDLCHRVEATMSRIYGGWQVDALNHAWARFAANQSQSGRAAVGTCHWPANATHEYDFDNSRVVASTAPDWLSYPHLTGREAMVNREAWGGPDYARNYFRWWFAHVPKAEGTAPDGRLNNWWTYVFDFDRFDDHGRPRR